MSIYIFSADLLGKDFDIRNKTSILFDLMTLLSILFNLHVKGYMKM